MSESIYQSRVDAIQRDLVRLEKKKADLSRSEAGYVTAASRALASITKSTSTSTAESKRRQARSAESSAERDRSARVRVEADIARKHGDLASAQRSLQEAKGRRERDEARRSQQAASRREQEDQRERLKRAREMSKLQGQLAAVGRELSDVTSALSRELPDAISVLLLYADPSGELRLDEEMRNIEMAVRQSELRDRFQLHQRWAARPGDIVQALAETKPTIVHISGHGDASGALVFQSDDGGERVVPAGDVAGLIASIGENVRLVVFNVCDSDTAAREAALHVEVSVGMDAPVTDEGAAAFAAGLYKALGAGLSVKQAFDAGRFELRNTPAPRSSEGEPVLVARGDVDPGTVFLLSRNQE